MKLRTRPVVLAAASVFAVAGVAVFDPPWNRDNSAPTQVDSSTQTARESSDNDGVFEHTPPGTVCSGGRRVNSASDLAGASAHVLAKGAVYDRAWLCGRHAAFMYGEVELFTLADSAPERPADQWRSLAAQDGGTVTQVQGYPAYRSSGDRAKDIYPGLLFYVEDHLVTLLGTHRASTSDLEELAARLDLTVLHGHPGPSPRS